MSCFMISFPLYAMGDNNFISWEVAKPGNRKEFHEPVNVSVEKGM